MTYDELQKENDMLKRIIGGVNLFTVSRKYDDKRIHATLYKRGEVGDGTFIRLVLPLEDFGAMVKAELDAGKTVDEVLAAILGDVKAASAAVIK